MQRKPQTRTNGERAERLLLAVLMYLALGFCAALPVLLQAARP